MLCLALSSLRAELPVARLWTLFPAGGQAGKEAEVTVSGLDLEWPESIRFSHPGITGKAKEVPEEERLTNRKFLVRIDAEVPDGVYEARFVGRFGISNPRPFAVGRLNEMTLGSEEGLGGTPKRVERNTVVNGRVPSGGTLQLQLAGRKGEPLDLVCVAPELDSRLEPVLLARDASGRELARSRQGGVLRAVPKADGDLEVTIHDNTFRGGEEYFFRLIPGGSGVQDLVLPPVAGAGRESKLTLRARGDGKQGAGAESGTSWTLPADGGIALPGLAPVGRWVNAMGIHDRALNVASLKRGVWVGWSDLPVVLDEARETAQRVVPPCEIAGRFSRERRVHTFEFEAAKGEVYQFDLYAQRLSASSVDGHLVVQRLNREGGVAEEKEIGDLEENLGGHEYNTSSRDPSGRFEVKEAGRVRLLLKDLARSASREGGPVYRLRVRRETPDFSLLAVAMPPPPPNRDVRLATVWTTHARRGERVPLRIFLRRTGGMTNAVRVELEGTPPGLRAWPLELAANRSTGWLMLEAGEEAPGWQGALNVVGRSVGETNPIVRRASTGMVVWNVADANNERVSTRLTADLAASISGVERAVLRIGVESTNAFEAKSGSKITFPLKLERGESFDRVVKIKAVGLPALDAAKEIEVAAKTNAGAYELDLAQAKLAVGEHTFFIEAVSQGAYRRLLPDEVKAVQAKITAAETELKKTEEWLKSSKENTAKTPETEASKAKIQESEKQKEKWVADIKRWQESIKPQDLDCRAWSAPVKLKVLP